MTKSGEQMLCPDKTPLQAAVSAMTFSLRNGREVEAYYWAHQIQVRYPKYLWRRLGLFAAQDIGIANPDAIVIVSALASTYRAALEEARALRPDGALVAMACIYLARSPKNRDAHDLKNSVANLVENKHWKPSVPADQQLEDGHDGYPRKPD